MMELGIRLSGAILPSINELQRSLWEHLPAHLEHSRIVDEAVASLSISNITSPVLSLPQLLHRFSGQTREFGTYFVWIERGVPEAATSAVALRLLHQWAGALASTTTVEQETPPASSHAGQRPPPAATSDQVAGMAAAVEEVSREVAALRSRIDALRDQVAHLVERQSDAPTSQGQTTSMHTQMTPLHEVAVKRLEDDSRAKVLKSLEMLTSSDAGRALGSKQQDPRRVASAWRRRGALLGIPLGREVRYPAFQFDIPSHRIKPGVADANKVLNARDDPWGVASWWVSASGWLEDDRCPLDLAVAGDDDTLRELARSVVGAA